MKLETLNLVTLLACFASGMESRKEYKILTTDEPVNAFQAWKHCLNKNKTLASIQNAREERTIIETFQQQTTVEVAWLGLYRIKEVDMIVWMDGSSSKYIKNKPESNYFYNTFGNCAVYEVNMESIITANCNKIMHAYVCQSVIDLTLPSPSRKKGNVKRRSKSSSTDSRLKLGHDIVSSINKIIARDLALPTSGAANSTNSYNFAHVKFVPREVTKNMTLLFTGSGVEKYTLYQALSTSPAFDIPSDSDREQKTIMPNNNQKTRNVKSSTTFTENASKAISMTKPSSSGLNNLTLKSDARQTTPRTSTSENDLTMHGYNASSYVGKTSSTFPSLPLNSVWNNLSTKSAEKPPLTGLITTITSELVMQEMDFSTAPLAMLTSTEYADNPHSHEVDSFTERMSSEKDIQTSKDSQEIASNEYFKKGDAVQALRNLEDSFIQLALNYREFEFHDEFYELQITTRLIGESDNFSNSASMVHFASSNLDKIFSPDLKKGDELTAVASHIHPPTSAMQIFNENTTTVNSNDQTRNFLLNNTGVMTISAVHRAMKKVVNATVSFTIIPPSVPSIDSIISESNASIFESQSVTKNIEFSCKFIDLEKKIFSSQGCESESSSDPKSAHCKCSHTTAFSVLLSVTTYEVPHHVKIVSFVTQSISITFLIGTLIVLMKVKEKIRNDRTPVQINLAFALLLLHSISICHDIALLHSRSCEIAAVLTHFSLLASVSWMLVEGITLLTKTLKSAMVKRNERKVLIMRYGIGWVLPACITLISAAVGFATQSYMKVNPAYTYVLNHKQPMNGAILQYNQCWIGSRHLLVASVVIPVAFILAANTFILIRMSCIIFRLNTMADNFKPAKKNRSSTFRNSRHLKATVKSVALLLPVLGLPLIVGFLAGIRESSLVWMYLTSIVNGLQGFFIFVIYCVRGSEVRNAAVRSWTHSWTHSYSDRRPRDLKFVSVLELKNGKRHEKGNDAVNSNCSVEGKYTLRSTEQIPVPTTNTQEAF